MNLLLLTIVVLVALNGCGGTGTSSTQPLLSVPPPNQERPMLLIRLSYDNIDFHNDAAAWHRKIFGFENHQLNHYFHEVSYGNFSFYPAAEDDEVPNDGIISITLPRNHPDSGMGNAIDVDLSQAIVTADAHIDFAQYDSDRNGALTPDELQLVFIVAGNEDAFTGDNASLGVWAHESCTERRNTPTVDGVSIMGCQYQGNYALFGERHGDRDATIGIIAHELGHAAFNLPDLYDTTDRSAGVGYFALMGAGMWGRDGLGDLPGNTPTHLCAWSKSTLQWIIPTTLNDANNLHVNFYAVASPKFNVLKLPVSKSEYFLLENRHYSGYDRGLKAIAFAFEGGLAVWHIDEKVITDRWADNTVNVDVLHKGVDLLEASRAVLDDDAAAYGNKENLFYQGNVDTLTPDTMPSTAGYNGRPSGINITDISPPSEVMHATISL